MGRMLSMKVTTALSGALLSIKPPYISSGKVKVTLALPSCVADREA